jgi:uncharacterized protein (TIGR02147 family)
MSPGLKIDKENLPDIFRYLDYRLYLKDLFYKLKKENPRFSYRTFARLAGSTSPNFFQLIQKRTLNIQSSNISALAGALGLSRKEEVFLENLAGFDQAKSHEEKDKYYQRILATKTYTSIKELDKKQYEYYSNWYNPVVRELLIHPDFKNHPKWMTERIFPKVSVPNIIKSIELLKSLNLIKFNEKSGKWVQVDTVISTPSEVLSLAVTNFHNKMIEMARQTIKNFGPKQRDIRSVTLGLSPAGYKEVKKRLESFWREILDFAETQKTPEHVYQLNMQLFPMTKQKGKSK